MKRLWVGILVMMFVIIIPVLLSFADDNYATADECVAMVDKVVERIKSEGFDAVKVDINATGGPYGWKDSYIFCFDTKEGIVLAHPYMPSGPSTPSLLNMTDMKGKAFIKEMLDTANKDGKGWVEYYAQRKGVADLLLKKAYVVKVPDEEIVVGAGYFPIEK